MSTENTDANVNKVVVNGETVLDLTNDTVTSDTLLQGATAHDKTGTLITGSASAGVSSFNGRSGAVTPQSGDYTADMVGADASGAAAAVQGSLDSHTGDSDIHIAISERNRWNQSIVWLGEYDETGEYNTYDAVSYMGSCYVCLGDGVSNVTPPSDTNLWSRMANGVFIAIYGTTTFAEVEAAVIAGAMVFCRYENYAEAGRETLFPLTLAENGGVFYFNRIENTESRIVVLYTDDSWEEYGYSLLSGTVAVSSGGTGYTSITDTTYTTARYRASALYSTETDPTVNGVINWTYE